MQVSPHTVAVHTSRRIRLSIVAPVAIALLSACSGPAPQPPASVSTEQTPAQGQSAAASPQENAGAPAISTPPPAPASEAAARPAPAPMPAAAPAPAAVPAAAPAPVKPKVARLTAGQMITVRTTRVMSTKTMKTGDVFSAILEEPIKSGDWTAVPAGARVDGRIVTSDDGGRLKGKANLAIELTSLTIGGGQKLEIVTSPVTAEAAANKKKDAAKIGVGAGAGAAIGAIAGGGQGAAVGALIGGGAGVAMRGDAAEIPAESVVSFELRSPVTIQEKK